MRMSALALLLALGAVACGLGAEGTVHADVFSRYDPDVGGYTVEAELSAIGPDSTRVAYRPAGGLRFLGRELEAVPGDATFAAYRAEVPSAHDPAAALEFEGLSAKPLAIPVSLPPQDSVTVGQAATHNFGLTAFSVDPADRLGPDESLVAVYRSDAGETFLGELHGPSQAPQIFQFHRTAVAAWPVSRGTLTFIRRRVTPLDGAGLRGTLTEEVYSRPQRSGVYN